MPPALELCCFYCRFPALKPQHWPHRYANWPRPERKAGLVGNHLPKEARKPVRRHGLLTPRDRTPARAGAELRSWPSRPGLASPKPPCSSARASPRPARRPGAPSTATTPPGGGVRRAPNGRPPGRHGITPTGFCYVLNFMGPTRLPAHSRVPASGRRARRGRRGGLLRGLGRGRGPVRLLGAPSSGALLGGRIWPVPARWTRWRCERRRNGSAASRDLVAAARAPVLVGREESVDRSEWQEALVRSVLLAADDGGGATGRPSGPAARPLPPPTRPGPPSGCTSMPSAWGCGPAAPSRPSTGWWPGALPVPPRPPTSRSPRRPATGDRIPPARRPARKPRPSSPPPSRPRGSRCAPSGLRPSLAGAPPTTWSGRG